MAGKDQLLDPKMDGKEQLFGVIISEFEQQLDKALDNTGLQGDDRQALRSKYTQSFNQNIKFGVMKTFGELAATETPATATDLTKQSEEDLSADDIERMQGAMESAASKRSRYPEKCGAMLKKTLATNYKTLNVLQAVSPVVELDQIKAFEDPSRAASLETTSANIHQCKVGISESLEKAGRLINAYNILDSNNKD